MPGDLIEAAAAQESEVVQVESSAVVAEAAAESAVLAAESAVMLANVQAAEVAHDAAVEIREHVEQVEILEGSIEWAVQRLNSQETMLQSLQQELRTMGEAIQQLTLSQVATILEDSPASTPPNSPPTTEVIAQVAQVNPQNADAVDQKAAETQPAGRPKRTKRFL